LKRMLRLFPHRGTTLGGGKTKTSIPSQRKDFAVSGPKNQKWREMGGCEPKQKGDGWEGKTKASDIASASEKREEVFFPNWGGGGRGRGGRGT